MPEEKKEQPFIEPKGTEGLNFKGFGKPKEITEEKASAETGEGGSQDDVLTLEEMRKRFPKLKVKMSVAGEEKILSADELGQHYQLTHGRERTIEQRNTESARLQEETRRLHAEALEMRGTAGKAKFDEPPADPDDPGVFVDTRVNGVIESKVTPQMEALNRKVDALLEAIEPTIEDSQAKKAKTILASKGISAEVIASFDDYRQARLDGFAEKAGRTLTPREIAGVSGERWAIDFSMAVASGQVKPKAEEKSSEKLPVQRTVTVKTVGAGGGSGGGGYRPDANSSEDSSLRKFATGTREERAAHLIKKGVRPWGS